MTTDQRIDAAMKWHTVLYGLSHLDSDNTQWWNALIAVFDMMGVTYSVDYLWWVVTGQRQHGMAECNLPDEEYILDVRQALGQSGGLPTIWE